MISGNEKNLKRYTAGILLDDKKVLLAKRTVFRTNYPGIWDFVGGHCEVGESFEDALKRELLEEIGICPTRYAFLMTVNNKPYFILNLYIVTHWEGEVSNKDEQEHEKIEWFSLQEAEQLEFVDRNYLTALGLVKSFKAIPH